MTVLVNLYFLPTNTDIIKTIQRLSEQFDSLKLVDVDASENYNFVKVIVKIPMELYKKLDVQLTLMQIPHRVKTL